MNLINYCGVFPNAEILEKGCSILNIFIFKYILCSSNAFSYTVTPKRESNYWWLITVTLVVAFGFLPQNFGRWWGPTNCHFARKGMQLQWYWQCQVVGTLKHYKARKENFELYSLAGGGDANFFWFSQLPSVSARYDPTWCNFHYIILINVINFSTF